MGNDLIVLPRWYVITCVYYVFTDTSIVLRPFSMFMPATDSAEKLRELAKEHIDNTTKESDGAHLTNEGDVIRLCGIYVELCSEEMIAAFERSLRAATQETPGEEAGMPNGVVGARVFDFASHKNKSQPKGDPPGGPEDDVPPKGTSGK